MAGGLTTPRPRWVFEMSGPICRIRVAALVVLLGVMAATGPGHRGASDRADPASIGPIDGTDSRPETASVIATCDADCPACEFAVQAREETGPARWVADEIVAATAPIIDHALRLASPRTGVFPRGPPRIGLI